MDALQTSQMAQQMPQQQPRKLSEAEPEQFIIKIADNIANSNQTEDYRCREYVTLTKRQRGSAYNLSDAIGIFSLDGRKWLDVEVSNIRVLNIIDPAIRANTTTMSQANVALEIKPAVSKRKGSASVAIGINEFLESKHWTEQLEFLTCERPQISACVFIRAYFDKNADEQMAVPEVIETEMEGEGEFACLECGLTGTVTSDEITEDGYPCPECNQPTELEQMSESSFVPVINFKNQKHGASRTEVISSFEVRMDSNGTAGGNFQNGAYFEWHRLETREDLEDKFEWFELGTPNLPSYTLRWQHALEKQLKTVRESWSGDKQMENDLFEVRYIYLKPSKYKKYVAPSDWSLRDKETKQPFWTIQRGETWEEAIKRQEPSNKRTPKGIKFTLINGKLACPPEFADFCEEFAIVQFAPDGFSAWGRPFTILLSIQNDVNDLNTIMMLHFEKNSISNVVVDTTMFDFEDFEKDFVPTREGRMIDGDIRKHFAVVDPPRLGNEPGQYLQFLLAEANNVSGVQPAAQGQAQPGTPYHAQLLQVNQSQGLLATALKSKAQAKVNWLKNHLKIAQRHWSEEQFEAVRTQYGSEWKDEDIEDFYQCDVENDILISYVEGTEIPKTLLQREIKLQEFIAQVSQFAQLAPGTVTPQMMQELLSQLADHSNIEFDLGNFEGGKRLAEARDEVIKKGVEAFTQTGMQIPLPQVDPMTGQQTDPVAQIVQRIIQQGKITPNPRTENHQLQKEFWADRINAVSTDDDGNASNEILLGAYNAMWQLHDEAEVAFAQMQSMNQIKAQQPAMEFQQAQQAEQMAQQQQMAGEQQQQQLASADAESARTAEMEAQRQQAEQQSQQMQMADSQAQRAQADAHKQAELIDNQLQREHELNLLRNQPKKESK